MSKINSKVSDIDDAVKQVKELILTLLEKGSKSASIADENVSKLDSKDDPHIFGNCHKSNSTVGRGCSPFLTSVGDSVPCTSTQPRAKRKLNLEACDEDGEGDNENDGPSFSIRRIRFTDSQFPRGLDTLMEFPILDAVSSKKKENAGVKSPDEKGTTSPKGRNEKSSPKGNKGKSCHITCNENPSEKKVIRRRRPRNTTEKVIICYVF